MIPTDSEFALLYICYLGVFLYFSIAYYLSKRKKLLVNLTIFFIYTGFMIFIFSDKENFAGGGSLVVLFYGGIILISHVFIYVLTEFFSLMKSK